MAKAGRIFKRVVSWGALGAIGGAIVNSKLGRDPSVSENINRGARHGLYGGLTIAGAYTAVKSKTIRSATAAGARAFSGVVFRRIRGRIVPIRKRNK